LANLTWIALLLGVRGLVTALVKVSEFMQPEQSGDKSPHSKESFRLTVNLDPVVTHLRRDAHAVVAGEDDVGILIRHVAVDALPRDCISLFRIQPATLHLVTLETLV